MMNKSIHDSKIVHSICGGLELLDLYKRMRKIEEPPTVKPNLSLADSNEPSMNIKVEVDQAEILVDNGKVNCYFDLNRF
jgi:hypothetical protein